MSYLGVGAGAANDPATVAGLKVQIQRSRSVDVVTFQVTTLYRVRLVGIAAGVCTVLDTKVFQDPTWAGVAPVSVGLIVRDNYDGSTAALNTISVFMNGVTIATLSPVHSNIANSSGLDFAGAFTRRVGLTFDGNSDGNTKPCRSAGGQIVRRPQAAGTTPNAGRTDVVAFANNQVWTATRGEQLLMGQCGRPASGAPSTSSQYGLLGEYVSACEKIITRKEQSGVSDVTRNRVLAVDGLAATNASSIIVDTVEVNGAYRGMVYEWDTQAGGANTDVLGCSLVAPFGFRVMLAAPISNKSMWTVSASEARVGAQAHENFNLSDALLTAEATRAFSGTSPNIGMPADSIVALVPMSFDQMGMFCSRSIYMLDGDPGTGGRVIQVSNSTGIIGKDAWCFDNVGNVWWIGNGGLHAMPKGSREYTNADGERLPEYFSLVNVDARQVTMAYRASENVIVITITPRPGGADAGEPSKEVVYDIRDKAFWPQQRPAAHAAETMLEITGQLATERDIIIFCTDGYLRIFSDLAKSDDGEAIDSYIGFQPFELAGGDLESTLTDFVMVGGKGTGSLDYMVFSGESPVEALDYNLGEYGGALVSSPDFQGTAFAHNGGRQERSGPRVTAGAHALVLRQVSATEAWALESITCVFEPAGERRTQ